MVGDSPVNCHVRDTARHGRDMDMIETTAQTMLIDAIAIDFDGTYSKDPLLWQSFCVSAQLNKYTIICATSRTSPPPGIPPDIPVVCCGGEYKYTATRRAGYNVIICIDDQPQSWGKPQSMFMVKLIGAWKWILSKIT